MGVIVICFIFFIGWIIKNDVKISVCVGLLDIILFVKFFFIWLIVINIDVFLLFFKVCFLIFFIFILKYLGVWIIFNFGCLIKYGFILLILLKIVSLMLLNCFKVKIEFFIIFLGVLLLFILLIVSFIIY